MIVSKKRNKTEDIFCSTLNLTFQHMRVTTQHLLKI